MTSTSGDISVEGALLKKLINDPRNVVSESLQGLALAHPDLLDVHFDPDWVGRREPKGKGKVALLSGGGSGHEPLHLGFVGLGMLDAAVPGPVFTSPAPDPILAATRAVDRGAGVLYIVKNYTGDVLNFETAAELAEIEGIRVEQVLVEDDCSVEDSLYTAGRRGVAGTVFVEKLAGALAQEGASLADVKALALRVGANMRSMGLALSSGTVPHVGRPAFELRDGEIEMGVGIHGEPGYRRASMKDADLLASELYKNVRDDLGLTRGQRVIALVNGLGATPAPELYIVFRRVAALLKGDGIRLERQLVGSYVTSLDMHGVSLTLLRADDEMVRLFDAPVRTVGWTNWPCSLWEVR